MRSALHLQLFVHLPVFALGLLLLILLISWGAIVSASLRNRPSNFGYFPAG